MALQRLEVGFVSADASLVDFLAEVFELDVLPSITAGPGTVHRLGLPGGAVLKVMVPRDAPAAPEPPSGSFIAAVGLRYLTLYADDLDGILARATARRGRIEHGPTQLAPGVRLAVLRDPDGNAIEVVEKKG